MPNLLQNPRAKVAAAVAGGIIAFEACSLLSPRNGSSTTAVPPPAPARVAPHSKKVSRKKALPETPAPGAASNKGAPADAAPKGSGDTPSGAPTAVTTVVVHVAGRVHHPDVYSLPAAERVVDAVRLAGGALPDADLDSVNLAAHLEDGEQIYVPPRGAAAALAGDTGSNSSPALSSRAAIPSGFGSPGSSWNQMSPGWQTGSVKRPRSRGRSASSRQAAQLAMSLVGPPGRMPMAGPLGAQMAATKTRRPRSGSKGSGSRTGHNDKLKDPSQGIVNLNRAGAADLVRLPGVGPSTANRILQFRQANGPFTSVEDIMNVKGIGPAKFAKMRPFITVS